MNGNTNAVVVKESQLKRACLLFDNVTVHYGPEEIKSFFSAVDIINQDVMASLKAMETGGNDVAKIAKIIRDTVDRSARDTADRSNRYGFAALTVANEAKKKGLALHSIFGHGWVLNNVDACILLESEKGQEDTLVDPDVHIYTACLTSVPIVLESKLDWYQIWEFRADEVSLRQYRRLHRWLRTSLNASSVKEAEDIIRENLERYSLALRKHGIKTIKGGLKNILSIENIASTVASGFLAGSITGHEMARFLYCPRRGVSQFLTARMEISPR